MIIRRWDFQKDAHLVNSFLQSSAVAHSSSIPHSEEWFYWKFRDCPYGEAILICAFDGDTVAGCVAMGKWKYGVLGAESYYAGAFETFVHPAYQGKGLFTKIIEAVEVACKEDGIPFILTFPNSNSFRGYVKMGHQPHDTLRCKLQICKPLKVLLNIKSLKSAFVPNHRSKAQSPISDRALKRDVSSSRITPIWTKEYLRWRFEGLSNTEYCVVDNAKYFAVARVGYRGILKECQIIYLQPYDAISIKKAFREYCRHIQKVVSPDFITCSHSIYSDFEQCTRWFITVPTKVNLCSKSLGNEKPALHNMDVMAISFHTY